MISNLLMMKAPILNIYTLLILLGFIIAGLFVPANTSYATALTVTFRASPQTIDNGGQAILNWHSENAVECIVTGEGIVTGPGTAKTKYVGLGSDIVVVSPKKTTVYTIACKGKDTTFIPAQGETAVTVRGIENSGGSGSGNTSSNSSSFNFIVGCVANPERAKIGELTSFTATSVGGEGTLRYAWTGDAAGSGQKIVTAFTSSGTKTARITVTDSRNAIATTACTVFIEPSGNETIVSNTSSQSTHQPQNTVAANKQPQKDEEKKNEELLAATAESGGGNGLLLILIISILANMAILLYFFVYAKKKKDEKNKIAEEGMNGEFITS